MIFQQLQKGFTLIEIMVVVAVNTILAAIAIPVYSQQVGKAATNACLYGSKAYSNYVFYNLNNQDGRTFPIAPVISACHSITNAKDWTLENQQKIIAIAKSPSDALIECDVPNGSPCRVLPWFLFNIISETSSLGFLYLKIIKNFVQH